MKIFPMFLILGSFMGGCGTMPDNSLELRPDHPIAVEGSSLSFVSAVQTTLAVSDPNDPNLAITDRASCRSLMDFLGRLEPKWVIDNYYARIPEQQTSWKLQGSSPDFYHVTYPTAMKDVSFQVQYAGETKILRCVEPSAWKTVFYRDAELRWPSVLNAYQVDDPLNPGMIQEGSRAGFVFVNSLFLGYQPRLAWALFPQTVDAETVSRRLKATYTWLEKVAITVELKDLIYRDTLAPGEIFAFSTGPVYKFDTLLVKPTNLPLNIVVGGFYDPLYYDFSIQNLTDSIARNSKSGLEARTFIDSQTHLPITCDRTLPATSPTSCIAANKVEIFRKFQPLFTPSSQAKTYVLIYYRLHADIRDLGLVKIMAIDAKGSANLVYSNVHRYVTEALELLNGTVPSVPTGM